MGTLFFTGASGSIGRGLVERLAAGREIVALTHHAPPPAPCRKVPGNVTQPRLGLSPADYLSLTKSVTAIVHCAALTEFTAPPDRAEAVNVQGAVNLLAFARQCPRLERMGVLSTAYVAGRRCGTVLESELAHRAGFVNTYERSKYRMEQKLRQAMQRLPIAVYRLSTVAGNARTGRVEQFNALHRALRFFYNGLVPMLPGTGQSAIDLISSDYACDAVAHLFAHRFQAGRTYHMVARESDLIPLPEFLEITAAAFTRFDRRWRDRVAANPPIVPLSAFRLLERSAEEAGNAILRQVVHATAAFVPQLCFVKHFDTANTRQGLRDSAIVRSPLRDFYPRLVEDCLQTGWGARSL